MKRRETLPEIDTGVSPSLLSAAQSGEDGGIDKLSRQILSWSQLWFGSSETCAPTAKAYLVRERLISWLERCIGSRTRGILTDRGEEVSLATSAPFLTAFLGRRAMRELSRRVLQDL